MNRLTVTSNRYFDSVTLLAMSSKVRDIPGVSDASVVMATPANLAQCVATGLAVPEHASPNDLLVTVAGEADACDAALRLVDEMISSRAAPRLRSPSHPDAAEDDLDAWRSLTQAVRHEGAAQLALISVPGPYAAAEAAKALALGLHTMIFSDNVTVEDEVALKIYGGKHGLLVMGPDCGTAIVNGVPLGFANDVRRGPIGVIGASGTGVQEVTSLIHGLGSGISQAIGTGGRDLSDAVGGRTMVQAMAALEADPSTEVIVLVSKPPAPSALARVVEEAERLSVPVIAVFLGIDAAVLAGSRVIVASTLAEAAELAVAQLGESRLAAPTVTEAGAGSSTDETILTYLATAASVRPTARHRLFGGFCGGTFCYEAQIVLARHGIAVGSNAPLADHGLATGPGHLLVDFGADEYTVGRPHPMIDPTRRDEEVLRALTEPSTAVVVFDVVLGCGSADDPVGALLTQLPVDRDHATTVIAHVCGTERDRQGRAVIVERLRAHGVLVAASNAQAATWAAIALGAALPTRDSAPRRARP